MVRDITYLSPQQKEHYLAKIKHIDYLLNLKESGNTTKYDSTKSLDVVELRRKKEALLKKIENLSAPKVDDVKKNAMYKRLKEIKRILKINMPTKDEMMGERHRKADKTYYQKATESAIKKHMAWQEKNAALCREYKRIMRVFEPDNPNAGNIELLRKGVKK